MRHVLVAVSGQTPAVITETLWALEHRRGATVHEIRVITTLAGRDCILHQLLGVNGHFSAYCSDYGIPHGRIAFSAENIHVLRDDRGQSLEDIRNNRDNACAADQIYAFIRSWTQRQDEALLCSLAGGRKTMGVYLAMALMLCGRPCDVLTHVLVSPEIERGTRDFFYPSPASPESSSGSEPSGAGGEPLHQQADTNTGSVELAEIPFLRLRELLGGEIPPHTRLTEAVAQSQLLLQYLNDPPTLFLTLSTGEISIGAFSFRLSRQLTAVYAFFLQTFNEPSCPFYLEDLYARRDDLANLERQTDRLRLGERDSYPWETMRDREEFRTRLSPCITKINKAIRAALGRNRFADHFTITGGRHYGVSVPSFHIRERDEGA